MLLFQLVFTAILGSFLRDSKLPKGGCGHVQPSFYFAKIRVTVVQIAANPVLQSMAKNRFWALANGLLSVVLRTLCGPVHPLFHMGYFLPLVQWTNLRGDDCTQQGTQDGWVWIHRVCFYYNTWDAEKSTYQRLLVHFAAQNTRVTAEKWYGKRLDILA